MKKAPYITKLVAILVLAATSLHAQILKLDTFMYSPSLDTVKMVDVILPPGYNQNPNTYYPVVYYLHGWTGNQDENASLISYMNSYITQGYVEPFIMVKPSSWCEPFEGSFYTNSSLWGNYQDYVTEDVVAWVDSSFRTVPQKSHRGLIGQSMGSYGCLFLPISHPGYYRAAAGHAGGGSYYNHDSLVEIYIGNIYGNNPPYTYVYNVAAGIREGFFPLSGAFSPNPNSTQTYISPQIVDFPLDEYGNVIDSTWEKHYAQSAEVTITQLSPSDSISFLLSCGMQDDFFQFEPMADLVDTMLAHGLDVEWLPHSGDHAMPTVFKNRSLIFLDSILGDPELIIGIPEPEDRMPEYRFWPNPANIELNLELAAGDGSIVSAELYDIDGRLVRTLIPETRAAGAYSTRIDIRGLAYGTYLLHLRVGNRHIYDKQIIH